MIYQVTAIGKLVKKCSKKHIHPIEAPTLDPNEDGLEHVLAVVQIEMSRHQRPLLRNLVKEIIAWDALDTLQRTGRRSCDAILN